MRRNLFFLSAIVFFAGVILIFFWIKPWDKDSVKQHGVREKVTMSVAACSLSAPIYLAQEKGYFAAEGVDVILRETPIGKIALQEVLSGKANLATVAETPVIYAATAGYPLSILATLGDTESDFFVLGRKDHGIAEFADLKAKKIGLSRGTLSEYYFDRLLITLGIPENQVQVLDVPPDRLVTMLAKGKVDAIVTRDPLLSGIQEKLSAKTVKLKKDELVRTSWMVVTSSDYAHHHPATVKAILRALIRAEATLHRAPEEARRITSRGTGVDSRLLALVWPNYHFEVALDQSLIVTLEEQSRWAIAKGHMHAKKIPNFLSVIDFSFLQDIQPERVQIVR